jgi:hypothetical protein
MLADDLTGHGHTTRVIGDGPQSLLRFPCASKIDAASPTTACCRSRAIARPD